MWLGAHFGVAADAVVLALETQLGEGHEPGDVEMPWIEVRHFLTRCLFYAQPTFHVGGARPSLVLSFECHMVMEFGETE